MLKGNHRRTAVRASTSPRRRIYVSLFAVLSLLVGGTLALAAPAQADTSDDWEEVQALGEYNGALTSFEDPNIGPVIIFPSDYAGDINNLTPPPNWTDSSGNTPTSWPTPTTAKSSIFTATQTSTIESAVLDAVQPDGDTAYDVSVTYDGMSDRVVAQTNAPSSVTDPLATQYSGQLVIDRSSADSPTLPCDPAHGPLASGYISDPLTQLQELANYNCAISYFEDPNIGPVIIFPSDYTGDINNLQTPPNWTDSSGNTPTGWPTPTTAHSVLFSSDKVKEVQKAAYTALSPNGDNTHNTFVYYDGMSDRVVVVTDAPSSLTDPLLSAYPGMITIQPGPEHDMQLINVNSGKALDAVDCGSSDGTSVQQWTSLNNACQQWRFAPTDDGHYTITNTNSGKVLDDVHCGTWQGATVDLWSPLGNACQKWDFAQVDGHYTITNVQSGQALEVKNCSTADAGVVRQWPSLGNTCQQWDISF
ncbi:RICIN domain-containing protein [Streptomyces mirabilis]|uniref:RICIN domain-containing protein n=1 Tax=Streptomyces mirabilis TaxID=68239 RepID=UPI003326C162